MVNPLLVKRKTFFKRVFCFHYWLLDMFVPIFPGGFNKWTCCKCGKTRIKAVDWNPINYEGI